MTLCYEVILEYAARLSAEDKAELAALKMVLLMREFYAIHLTFMA
jgi:hypothetical protein